MIENLLQECFGLTKSDSENVVKDASKLLQEMIDEAIEKKCDYFNAKGFYYDNGELKEKCEKEFVNGKCTKDEHYSVNDKDLKKDVLSTEKCLRNNRNVLARKKKDKENEELRKENENLRAQIQEMTTYIDGVNDKIKKLEIEKSKLNSILDNIKNAFN